MHNDYPYLLDVALGIITAGVIAVVRGIWPLLPEFFALIMAPVGSAMQWVACRVQEAARRLWDSGRRIEAQSRIARRSL